ncbi:hypothetical protein BASA81_008458 [Batrachochytrium salamandrivorans]|nr:hypothetical protein BASA81_008458 [Batrachochytrium salamandrivorans]
MPSTILSRLTSAQLVVGLFFLISALSPEAHWVCTTSHLIVDHCVKPVDIWNLNKYLSVPVSTTIQSFAVISAVIAFLGLVLSGNKQLVVKQIVAGLVLASGVFSLVPWVLILIYVRDQDHSKGFAVHAAILASFSLLLSSAALLFPHKSNLVQVAGLEGGDLEGKLLSQSDVGINPQDIPEPVLLVWLERLAQGGAVASVLSVIQLLLSNGSLSALEAKTVQVAVSLLSGNSVVLLVLLRRNVGLSPHLFAVSSLTWMVASAAVVLVTHAQGRFELAALSSLFALLSALGVSIGAGSLVL